MTLRPIDKLPIVDRPVVFLQLIVKQKGVAARAVGSQAHLEALTIGVNKGAVSTAVRCIS